MCCHLSGEQASIKQFAKTENMLSAHPMKEDDCTALNKKKHD
jgi:hypothetical protein